MSLENALLMKLSNDVEKYEIEVTKMVKSTHFFLQRICSPCKRWQYVWLVPPLTDYMHTSHALT